MTLSMNSPQVERVTKCSEMVAGVRCKRKFIDLWVGVASLKGPQEVWSCFYCGASARGWKGRKSERKQTLLMQKRGPVASLVQLRGGLFKILLLLWNLWELWRDSRLMFRRAKVTGSLRTPVMAPLFGSPASERQQCAWIEKMWPAGIKDDVFCAEVVISTVGETVNGAEREGETDKAGLTKTEMETAETRGTASSSPSSYWGKQLAIIRTWGCHVSLSRLKSYDKMWQCCLKIPQHLLCCCSWEWTIKLLDVTFCLKLEFLFEYLLF